MRVMTVVTAGVDPAVSRVQEHRLDPGRLADHRGRLFRAAYAMCGSREDAEDLVQETYERALRRPRFVQRDHDLAYLLRILRRTWWAQSRTAAHRRSTPTPPEDLEWVADRNAEPQAALDAQLAYAAISELSEPLRVTIVAVDIVGLSYKEAAHCLRTRTGTIMSRLHRAREQVCAALEGT
jgi:RNA polymerase sigma-70 factor (ECF subfamily)